MLPCHHRSLYQAHRNLQEELFHLLDQKVLRWTTLRPHQSLWLVEIAVGTEAAVSVVKMARAHNRTESKDRHRERLVFHRSSQRIRCSKAYYWCTSSGCDSALDRTARRHQYLLVGLQEKAVWVEPTVATAEVATVAVMGAAEMEAREVTAVVREVHCQAVST